MARTPGEPPELGSNIRQQTGKSAQELPPALPQRQPSQRQGALRSSRLRKAGGQDEEEDQYVTEGEESEDGDEDFEDDTLRMIHYRDLEHNLVASRNVLSSEPKYQCQQRFIFEPGNQMSGQVLRIKTYVKDTQIWAVEDLMVCHRKFCDDCTDETEGVTLGYPPSGVGLPFVHISRCQINGRNDFRHAPKPYDEYGDLTDEYIDTFETEVTYLQPDGRRPRFESKVCVRDTCKECTDGSVKAVHESSKSDHVKRKRDQAHKKSGKSSEPHSHGGRPEGRTTGGFSRNGLAYNAGGSSEQNVNERPTKRTRTIPPHSGTPVVGEGTKTNDDETLAQGPQTRSSLVGTHIVDQVDEKVAKGLPSDAINGLPTTRLRACSAAANIETEKRASSAAKSGKSQPQKTPSRSRKHRKSTSLATDDSRTGLRMCHGVHLEFEGGKVKFQKTDRIEVVDDYFVPDDWKILAFGGIVVECEFPEGTFPIMVCVRDHCHRCKKKEEKPIKKASPWNGLPFVHRRDLQLDTTTGTHYFEPTLEPRYEIPGPNVRTKLVSVIFEQDTELESNAHRCRMGYCQRCDREDRKEVEADKGDEIEVGADDVKAVGLNDSEKGEVGADEADLKDDKDPEAIKQYGLEDDDDGGEDDEVDYDEGSDGEVESDGEDSDYEE